MFTGLITEVGTLAAARATSTGRDLVVRAPRIIRGGAEVGESIATNGICLTVVSISADSFTCHAGAETLDRTTAGQWQPGQLVNLEQSLRVGDRLGGHFVQGHVDCTGTCLSRRSVGETVEFQFALPSEQANYLIEKGSIAVDGISLTITAVGDSSFSVAIIPHTLGNTTLSAMQPGRRVNLEVDMLAKYVRRAMGLEHKGITPEFLIEHGFG